MVEHLASGYHEELCKGQGQDRHESSIGGSADAHLAHVDDGVLVLKLLLFSFDEPYCHTKTLNTFFKTSKEFSKGSNFLVVENFLEGTNRPAFQLMPTVPPTRSGRSLLSTGSSALNSVCFSSSF